MSKNRKTLHAIGLPLILAGFVPGVAMAEPAGLNQLLSQGRYWQGKGRGDLARQAYNRALTIDPANKEARAALSGKPAQAAPPAKAPKPAVPAIAAAPVQAAPAKAAPRPTPAPAAPVDRSGSARAAGFRALDAGQLSVATTKFKAALAANPSDADAMGGLGIVKLRSSRFGEARDLLARASSLGSAAKWTEALDAARFYAGMDAARGALAAGRLDQAESLAKALASSSFSDKASANALLASVYEQQGRYTEAADLYRTLGQSGGAGANAGGNALRNQALAAMDGGDAAGAERLLREGMSVSPNDPWIAYDLATLLNKQGRAAESDALVRSLAYSEDPQPLYAAALILNQSGRTTDAAAVMTRIAPGKRTQEMRDFASGLDALATIQQAKTLAARGAQSQALATLRQAADARGLSADRMGALAQAMLDLGDMQGATQVARDALRAPATSAGAYDSVVRVLARTGQDNLAATAVQKASALAGSSLAGQNGVADLNATLAVSQADRLREMGQFAPAFDTLQSAWNAAPGNAEILTALARLYQSGGMNGQAAQAFRMALATKPADKGVLIGLMDSASAAGDFRTARGAAEQAIRAHPEDYEVYMAAARMAQARGDYGESVKYLKAAKALYVQKSSATSAFATGNPFAGMQQGTNPFRMMQAAPQQQMVNPFALGTSPMPGSAGSLRAMPQSLPQSMPVGQGGMPRSRPVADADMDGASALAMAQGLAPMTSGSPAFGNLTFGQQVPMGMDQGDPVLAAIDRQLQETAVDSGPRVDVDTGYRSRTGEIGLSRLREIAGSAKISTSFAGGRVGLSARAVSIDSGQPTGSGLARFGTNGTPEAEGIVAKQPSQLVAADTQHASGVALAASYESRLIKAEVGSTPLGFLKSHMTGHFEITPRLSAHSSARVWVKREPVTDSVISYAGTTDPRTGLRWGAVMKSGGGVSLSFDRDGNGVYADAAYNHYDGTAVRDNEGIEVNVGGYLRAWQNGNSGVSVGFNANFQNFDNNQNYFSYGHGGYFSPQSFISINFPVRYSMEKDGLKINAGIAPGYQSYDQQSAALYPTGDGAQAVLDYLKTQNSDVRARYDSASRTGFGLSASASAYYSLSPATRIGGDLSVNTFGEYKEFKTLIGIRQQIGGK